MLNAINDINVTTESGKVLKGKLFHNQTARTVFIAITGVEGNIKNNPFYSNIGQTLTENNIDFIVGHTQDAFNKVKYFNKKTNKSDFYGAWHEKFEDSDEDVKAYVDYAESLGYKNIILGGQSLGVNKAIYYLSQSQDKRVKKFLLLSPVNINTLRSRVPIKQKQVIFTEKKQKNDEKILPFRLFGWLRADVGTAYQWLTNETLNNVHLEARADFSQIRNIDQTGALLIGTHDGFTGGDARRYLTNINNHFTQADKNKLIFISNASHIYRGKEQEVALKILKLIKEWEKENFSEKN